MGNVHPDHAALIADLRDNARALRFSLVLSANFIESQVDLNDRAADALASAPSPRTPLPQAPRATGEGKAAGWIIDYAYLDKLNRALWNKGLTTPGAGPIQEILLTHESLLAAAPKVEQRRCPSCESIVAVLTCHDPFHEGTNEQRTPKADELAEAMYMRSRTMVPSMPTWRNADYTAREVYLRLAETAIALFTSPEAPESETR